MANIRNSGWCKVCLEIRNAHSPVLLDGLAKQLPRFMDSQKAEFGIFLVMWYGTYFSRSQDVTVTNLEAELVWQQFSSSSGRENGFTRTDLMVPSSQAIQGLPFSRVKTMV